MTYQAVSERLADLGREFYRRGWALGTSGNFSAVIDREPLMRDRAHGASLTALAASYRISRASVSKVLRAAKECSHNLASVAAASP